jgi:hypothetical protein
VRISSSLNIRRPRRVICTAAQARAALDAPALRWRLLALTGSVFKSLFSRSPAMVPASSLPLLFVLNAEISAFADNGTEWNPRGARDDVAACRSEWWVGWICRGGEIYA